MNIVNCTPHSVTFCLADGNIVVPPSGQVARLSTRTVSVGEINGIPVTATEYGEITGLPDEKDGTIYIVSSLVAQRCLDRNDVFIPSESVRNSEGVIIGCKSLGVI